MQASHLRFDAVGVDFELRADSICLPSNFLLHLRQVRPSIGPGNALLLRVRHEHHAETFTGHGERGVSSEKVAERLADEADIYLRSDACVDEHLSDQLLLPVALAGGGSFTVPAISDHLRSNARLIETFLPVQIDWAETGDGWRVTVAG